MRPYTYTRPRSVADAVAQSAPGTAYLAGGTTLVDLMKLEVETPAHVIDINRLDLRGIRVDAQGLYIGANERMVDVARSPAVREGYPLVALALDLSASTQLRNMASTGGNLLQRTRCGYFRDTTTPCNKREPGSGCSALTGYNRMHAVLGGSDSCVATHPSDLAVALTAVDAAVDITGAGAQRSVPLSDFYLLPGDTPQVETVLAPGEIITGISAPRLPWARHSTYVKVRDRRSYEFAVTSAAVAVDRSGGRITGARVAVGGVGTRPWRLPEVERRLVGATTEESSYWRAAAVADDGARPLEHNAFKTDLLKATIVRALVELERQP